MRNGSQKSNVLIGVYIVRNYDAHSAVLQERQAMMDLIVHLSAVKIKTVDIKGGQKIVEPRYCLTLLTSWRDML